MLIGRSRPHLRVILSRNPSKFAQPHYQRRGKREFRLITAHDVEVLRAMFPIYVKTKFT